MADGREKLEGMVGGSMGVRTWLRLMSCATTMEKSIRRRFADEFDTTLPRFDVLMALYGRPEGLTMGELSKILLVTNGNVTAPVRQLEEAGMVKVTPALTDKRTMIAVNTPEGNTFCSELQNAHHGWVDEMLEGVSQRQLQQLFEILATVKKSVANGLA